LRGTSNVLAGQELGIPIFGTQAHSWIMAFDREEDAFRAYFETFRDHTTLLLDTYDTLEAARKATVLGPALRGVRLDSGDLVSLSRRVRRILDRAGLRNTPSRLVPQPETEEWDRGMADRGIGTRQEKAEEVRQNDRGKIMQTQTLLLLSFCRDSSEEQEASEGEARRTQPHPAAFGFLLTRMISSAASCPILSISVESVDDPLLLGDLGDLGGSLSALSSLSSPRPQRPLRREM